MKDYFSNLILAIILFSCTHVVSGQLSNKKYFEETTPNENSTHIVARYRFPATFGLFGEADYSIWYGCGGSSIRSKLEKPFIWVEGIDLKPGTNQHVSNVVKSSSFAENLYLVLAQRGFDVVQLDFKTNPTYIQRNAEVLITLIQDLNAKMKFNGSTEEIVVMGTSMGAIVSRYALALMESRGIDHNVRLLISHDGPNQGANIPWGIQKMTQSFTQEHIGTLFLANNLAQNMINRIANVENASGSEAAFQLLRQSPLASAAVYRSVFKTYLEYVGSYPSNCRKIAISNGANNGTSVNSLGFQILDIGSSGSLSVSTTSLFPGIVSSLYSSYEYDVMYTEQNTMGHWFFIEKLKQLQK